MAAAAALTDGVGADVGGDAELLLLLDRGAPPAVLLYIETGGIPPGPPWWAPVSIRVSSKLPPAK